MPFLPHALMNFPVLSNFTTRALPAAVPPPVWPSATKMSPFGAIATSVGASNSSLPGPATPFLPSVSRTLPFGSSFITWCWPLSAIQRFPSLSIVSLCGLVNIPAPQCFSSLPDVSNWKTGSTLALGPPQVLPPAPALPQRSATQTVPSGAVVTLAVDPHFRPAGNCPQSTPG